MGRDKDGFTVSSTLACFPLVGLAFDGVTWFEYLQC